MSYSNDAQGSGSRRKIQRQQSNDKADKRISDVAIVGGTAISALGAVGLGTTLKAKNTTTKTVSNKGLTKPTEKNRSKVANRLLNGLKKGDVNLGRGDRMMRHINIAEKNNYAKSYNKGVFAGKVIRTMGKLSVPGIIATIMTPKKVGDATLKGNQGEYKRNK